MAKIYGPYKRKDNRWIIIINGSTISYPRYLMENHLNRKLKFWEEVDHIDGNPNNNDLTNLRILHKSVNASIAAIGNKYAKGYKQTEESKRTGEKNGMSKLSLQQVSEYRLAFRLGTKSMRDIIAETKLCRRTVENFIYERSYKA